jgi:phage baseplate assembly protein V
MIRAIVVSVIEGVIKRFSATGRPGETFADREYLQHYGLTSRPKPGAELVIIREGNHYLAIASDDRRYRIALEEGEVAIYTDEGDKVHLKRGRQIEVIGGEKVSVATKVAEIVATESCTVTSPEVEIVATTKVTMTTPLLEVTGSITSGANITAAGNVADAGGAKTMAGMRGTYNGHTHNDPQGGATAAPNEGM